MHRFVDRAADGHRLAHRLHRCGQVGFRAREFFERKARDFGDDIVDGRFERRRCDLGDVVVQFVQRVTDGQFGRDFRNRETCGLGCQSGRARHARVHFDDNHAAVFGVDRPLNVRTTGFNADLAQNRDRAVAHDLVFFVGQRQRGCHSDRVTCVHAHRVHVFDGTDDDGVVGFVADNFHFVFFPAQQRFIDQDLVHRRCVHARAAVVFVVFAVVRDTATCATQCKGGADDGRQTDFFQRVHRHAHAFFQVGSAVFLFRCGDDGGFGVFQTDAIHRFAEQFAVFGHFDGVTFRADHFDVELVEDTHFLKLERGVQTCLATHCRQQRVGAFLFDDLCHNFGRDRFDVGRICKARIGHDRRRV